jgi:hypothetical protein
VLVARFELAAMSRADLPESNRQTFTCTSTSSTTSRRIVSQRFSPKRASIDSISRFLTNTSVNLNRRSRARFLEMLGRSSHSA